MREWHASLLASCLLLKLTGAYVDASGYMGLRQSTARYWQYVDNPGTKYPYRVFSWGWLVQQAQKHNIARAKDWEVIDYDASARLNTPFTFNFDVAVNGFANPKMYDKDSSECQV